jgi:glycosyltransferase involved in cell wall biosynthesis
VFIIGGLAGLEMLSSVNLKLAKPVVLLVTPVGFDRESNYQNSQYKENNSRSNAIFLAEKNICSQDKTVLISDSKALLKDLESYFEMNISRNAHVIHIGHIVEKCLVKECNKSLLYFGPLRWRKGADILPPLLNEIKENFPEWDLTVATGGGELNEISDQLLKMKDLGVINFVFGPDEQTRHELMNAASVLLIPSRYESFGMVAVEGMAHGSFVLSTNIGGIPEVVGPHGVLCDKVTANSFYEGFVKAADVLNHSLEKRIQRATHSREYFSPERMMIEISVALDIQL